MNKIKVKISDIGKVIGGGTPSSNNPLYYGGEISWITPRDLSGYLNVFIEKGERNITELGLKKSSAQLLPKGTVLFTSRAPIGYVAIAGKELATNQGFKSVICNETRINNKYLYYYLKLHKRDIESISSGSTFKEVSGGVFSSLEIEIHESLREQEKIAEVLGVLDEKIELNRKMNKTLEEIGQVLITKHLVNKNVVKVRDITKVRSGFAFSSKNFDLHGEYRIVTIKNVQDGNFVTECTNNIKDLPANMPSNIHLGNGDVILSLTGNVGRVCIVYGKDKYLLNQRVAKLEPMNENTAFIYFYFRRKEVQDYMISISKGTAQQNLSPVELANSELEVPEEMANVNRMIKPIFDKLVHNMNEIQTLSEIRDSLLPKLMSGKVRVK